MREIFLDPGKENDAFQLSPNQILKIMKPLYGLSDSGDRWKHLLRKHMKDMLKLKSTIGDLSLYKKNVAGRLAGLSGVYVADFLQTGTKEFKKFTEKTAERFETKTRIGKRGNFMEMTLEQIDGNHNVLLDLIRYTGNIALVPVPCTFPQFSSIRQKLAWAFNTRPAITCAVAKSTQVTEAKFDGHKHALSINKIVRHVKKYPIKLRFPDLDIEPLHFRTYADARHANNDNVITQLEFIVTLSDRFDSRAIVGYKSYKCRRITRSALDSECDSFADKFDYSFMMKHDL